MKPPFAYYGGKTTLADRIVDLLPEHSHYVEPFAGSLSVLLAKPRSEMETVNDLDRIREGATRTDGIRTEVLWSNRPLAEVPTLDFGEVSA